MAALGKLHDPLLNWFDSHSNPPVAIISDFFLVKSLSEVEFGHLPGHQSSSRNICHPCSSSITIGSGLRVCERWMYCKYEELGLCFEFLDGLEAENVQYLKTHSGTRFIWVVKLGTIRQQEEGYGVVPNGFEDRIAGQGLVIKGWAPQVLILNHKAVGGFLSHCGWNSVSEAIVGGVMLLAWPMEADQYVNTRLLVDDIGVGVRAMAKDGGMKVKAKDLKEKAQEAASHGGSSMKDLDRLVEELRQLGGS
ncbi:Chaperone protein htpG family protein isoform 1 [Hibiscus syriacus]|uniref:Chaperone protein htpG family protein isoform 1 n=1 Tax=Hibiscus syriacus TaxID=106335 RepID=A0A6A3D1F3_HIBSY|nr:Chaperone protein htpG family protein isoform 1 [Hibiscus syriacus]